MTGQSWSGRGRGEPGLNVIMSERRRLLDLAYRMLGDANEAEDVVQETFARWLQADAESRTQRRHSVQHVARPAAGIAANRTDNDPDGCASRAPEGGRTSS